MRVCQHKTNREWFKEVHKIYYIECSDFDDMDNCEKYFIKSLNPKYNKIKFSFVDIHTNRYSTRKFILFRTYDTVFMDSPKQVSGKVIQTQQITIETLNQTISILQKQLEEKDTQLEEKDKQLEDARKEKNTLFNAYISTCKRFNELSNDFSNYISDQQIIHNKDACRIGKYKTRNLWQRIINKKIA